MLLTKPWLASEDEVQSSCDVSRLSEMRSARKKTG